MYLSHDDDGNDDLYEQNNDLYYTFRVRPDVPIIDLPDCEADPYAPVSSFNDLSGWSSITLEGMDSFMKDIGDMNTLGVDLLGLAFPASVSTPNPYWPLLTFPQGSSVDLLPSCDTAINAECDPHSYGDAGANLDAVFGTWLDDPPPIARVGGDAFARGEATLTVGEPYPNPFTLAVTVSVGMVEPGSATIQFLDILGRVVSRSEHTLAAGRNSVRIVASGLAAGVYILRVRVEGLGSRPVTFVRRLAHVR